MLINLQRLFWLGLALATLAIAGTSASYLWEGRMQPFLLERWQWASSRVWRGALYLHVAAGILCLLVALPQFQGRLLTRWPRVHRLTGRSYGYAVLMALVPSGLFLAMFAKGGFWGQVGFATQGLLLWWVTFAGVRAAMQGRIPAHRLWMIRSYALAASAITFRVVYIGLMWAGVAYLDAYLAAIWLSFSINLCLGESIVHRRALLRFLRINSTNTLKLRTQS